MFWSIVVAVLVVLGALAWWSSRRRRTSLDEAGVRRTRTIDEGRGSEYGGNSGAF